MINAKMRAYDYYLYNEKNTHGQTVLNKELQGKIKISINTFSQNVQNNILYQNAQFMGITHDKNIDDKYAIKFGDILLKVLYVNDIGRYKIVFMAKVH